MEGNIVYSKYPHILLLREGNNEPTYLTSTGKNSLPVWSPDGSKIAFVSIRDSHTNFEIYIMDADGNNKKRLTFSEHGFYENSNDPRWHWSGESIFFSSTVSGEVKEQNFDLKTNKIQTIFTSGKIPKKKYKPLLMPPDEMLKAYRQMSKDEKKGRFKDNKEWEEANESYEQRRKELFRIYQSPNGKYYAKYFKHQRKLMLVDNSSNAEIELKTKHYFPGGPAWSKDSKTLVYSAGYVTANIYDVNSGTYYEIELYRGDEEEMTCNNFSWSSDSKKIVYQCFKWEQTGKLNIVDIDTEEIIELNEGESPDWH